MYGDHQRIRDTYLRPFLTGEGCIRDHYGSFLIIGDMDDAEVDHAVMSFPHEVKGSCLFCHVTLNFNWIETPLPADSAHVLTASDEEPGKITLWCPSFEQGDDQELVLGGLLGFARSSARATSTQNFRGSAMAVVFREYVSGTLA